MATQITAKNAKNQPFMPVIRELVRAFHAFTAFDARALREAGLTVPQADVLFTLGNTQGMTCREIGEQTLITKGTLTGVLDRMEQKGLLQRVRRGGDRRCVHIELTDAGTQLFNDAFPRHITTLKSQFNSLTRAQIDEIHTALQQVRAVFE